MAAKAKNLIKDLVVLLGADNVEQDQQSRDLLSQDLYETGQIADVVVMPETLTHVTDIVKLARLYGRSIFVRGGGMSYSKTFLPNKAGAILVDMRGLNKIREINEDDLYVSVEAGCTWQALDQALAAKGLRAIFWGPFSGATATIGGSMSQGTANANSTKIETSSSAVLSFEVVTGLGDVLVTGSDAQANSLPVMRAYGPDMTGLFNADAGALGIKTAVTLKLEPRPEYSGGVSFAFESEEKLRDGFFAAARTEETNFIVGMDAETAQIRSGKTGLKEDLKRLKQIVSTAHDPVTGLFRGLKIALAGRRVFERAKFTAHFLVEGRSKSLLVGREKLLRGILKTHGDEIPNAAISLMRADWFPPLPVTRFDGFRQLPFHTILPPSQLKAFLKDYRALCEEFVPKFETSNIEKAEIYNAIGTNKCLFEPVLYWPDSLTEFHTKISPEFYQADWQTHADNPTARQTVDAFLSRFITLARKAGGQNIQIGKLYPYSADRHDENLKLLYQVKTHLDPDNIINPGALGLPK